MNYLVVQHTDQVGGSLSGAIDITKILLENNHVDMYIKNLTGRAKRIADDLGVDLVMDKRDVPSFDYFNGCNSMPRIIVKYLVGNKSIKPWREFFEKNNNKYDAVILNSSVLWPLRSVIQGAGIKCYCYVRETIKGRNNGLVNTFIRRELSYFDKVFFLTQFDLEQWDVGCESYVIPETIEIIRDNNSVTDVRKELNLDSQYFYVLYMGGMQKIKGADNIIRAFNYINNSKFRDKIKLIMLGDEGKVEFSFLYIIKYFGQFIFKMRWNHYIKKNRLNDLILREGYRVNITPWIKACNVMVFPVNSVHQPRPLYEAGALKRTIIVPDFPNYRDNIVDGYNAVFYKKGDAKSLYREIVRLYKNKNKLKTLSDNNYLTYKKNHDFGVVKNIADSVFESKER